MAKLFLFVVLISCIKTGVAVRLTNFEVIATTPFKPSLKSFAQTSLLSSAGTVYINQTLLYFNIYFNISSFECYLSTASLTNDLTLTHRVADQANVSCPIGANMFTLNGRVLAAVTRANGTHGLLTEILQWENEQWRPLSGNFPYVLGDLRVVYVSLDFRPHIGNPNSVYLMNECQPLAADRCHIHRLELIGDRVEIVHLAGFGLERFQEVSFFTVWNDTAIAFVIEDDVLVKKYTMPISEEPLAVGANSSTVVIEPVPGLVDGKGFQIENTVVLTGGRILRTGSRFQQLIDHASLLDLNTMQIIETDVVCEKFAGYLVDEENKRLIWLQDYGQNKVASLVS